MTTSGPRIVACGASICGTSCAAIPKCGLGRLRRARWAPWGWLWPRSNASWENRELACKRSRAELCQSPRCHCCIAVQTPLCLSGQRNSSLQTVATPIATCAQNQHKNSTTQRPLQTTPAAIDERCDANQPATPKGLVSRTSCGLTNSILLDGLTSHLKNDA